MITGIGTPNSHNKIPRPIVVFSKLQSKQERVGEYLVPARKPEFTDAARALRLESPRETVQFEQRVAVLIDGFTHLGVDVAGLAATRQQPVVFGRSGRKRHVRLR
jgi:hypothetical protein